MEPQTDKDGQRLCGHCRRNPVPLSRGTKPCMYCSRNCRQRAYEARKLREVIDQDRKSRVDLEASVGKSRDDAGESRDFARTSQFTPEIPAPAAGPEKLPAAEESGPPLKPRSPFEDWATEMRASVENLMKGGGSQT